MQVWLSFAHFEANPSELLMAETEIEEGETEEQHAAQLDEIRAAVPQATREAHEMAARNVYQRGYGRLREEHPDAKEEAVMLLEAWLDFEKHCMSQGEDARRKAVEAVQKKRPSRVKRKRPLVTPDGAEVGMEEYYDYIFPEENDQAPLAKLLAAAHAWKKQKVDV